MRKDKSEITSTSFESLPNLQARLIRSQIVRDNYFIIDSTNANGPLVTQLNSTSLIYKILTVDVVIVTPARRVCSIRLIETIVFYHGIENSEIETPKLTL